MKNISITVDIIYGVLYTKDIINQRHALESLAEIDFLLFVYDIWHNGPYSELIKIILRN